MPLTLVLVMVNVALLPSLYTRLPKSKLPDDGALIESGITLLVVNAGAGKVAELPLTVQLVSVAAPLRLYTPPPFSLAVFPVTVQLVSVTVPPRLSTPPPLLPAPLVTALPPVIVIPEIDAVDTPVDLEHPAQPAAADRHACLRACDRHRPSRVGQLELGARQGDRLRRLEDLAVKCDDFGATGRIRLADRPAQGADAAVVERVGDGERRQQRAVFERQHRRLHPPPSPGLDRHPPAPPLISRQVVTHGSVAPLLMNDLK